MNYQWREEKRQKSWLWVGLLFFAFYFTEAVLFWGPQPRIVAPPYAQLGLWGLFAVALAWVLTRPKRDGDALNGLEKVQYAVLSIGITCAAVGSTFLILLRTRDLTLGHAMLLFGLGQAGLIIGALRFNLGWLLAAVCWIGGGAAVLYQPSLQDYSVGAAVALGFILVGAFRACLAVPVGCMSPNTKVLSGPPGIPGG
jgi:hypothetical protein